MKTSSKTTIKHQIRLVAKEIAQFPEGKAVQKQEIGLAILMLRAGKIPALPSIFNGVIGSRENKDRCYEAFWRLVDHYLPDRSKRHYVGLPANQLGAIYSKVATMTACERDHVLRKWMMKYRARLHVNTSNTCITGANILDLIKQKSAKYNLFDLDLMCFAREKLIQSIADGLAISSTDGPSVMNLTTAIGRKITKQEYKELMPQKLFTELKHHNFKIVDHVSGYYRDRIIPMAYELVVFERKE